MNNGHVEQIREEGYAIIRGFMPPEEIEQISRASDEIYQEGLKHHTTFRDRNLLLDVIEDPASRERIVIQAHWFSWINAYLEGARRHPNYLTILEPLLGRNIKQLAHQLHFKPPGAKYTFYRYHQDIRFRDNPDVLSNLETSSVNAGLAIDAQNLDNGCLRVFPGSHKNGYLGLSEDRSIMNSSSDAEDLAQAGLSPEDAVACILEPGDLVLWTLFTLHGSGPNTSGHNRRFMINNYMRAEDAPTRGEWAFRDGVSTPLGQTPEICKYEQLHENPGPFYVENTWTDEVYG